MKIKIINLKQHKHKSIDYLYTATVTYRRMVVCSVELFNAKSSNIHLRIIHQELANKINASCNISLDDYVKSEMIKSIIKLDEKKFNKDSKQHILYGNPNNREYKKIPLKKPIAMYKSYELKQIVEFVRNNVCKENEIILNKNIN